VRIDKNYYEDVSPEKEALIISIIYLLIGSIWVLRSDKFFFKTIGDIERYTRIQTYKGWIFVLVTTVLIYFLVYDRVKKIRNINKVVHKSMEELSVTTEGLASTQEKLHREKKLTDNIIKNSTLIIFTWDLEGNILSLNPYGEKVTGYKEEEIIGKSWIELFLYDEEKPKVEGLVNYMKSGKSLKNSIGDVWKSKDGKDIELIWTDSPILDEDKEVVKVISIGTDITDQKNLVRRLNVLAYYDTLTGLPNRTLLRNEAVKFIKEAWLNNEKLVFLYIDIDNFKQINDTLGHDAGDELLIHIASILREEKEDIFYLAKLSEDEYGVVLSDIFDEKDIVNRTEKILEKISKPWCTEKHEFIISASIGISVFPDDADDFVSLMKCANMAMYQVKEKGKNGYAFYHEEMGTRIVNNTFLINQVKRAIDEEHFLLQYQSVIDLDTGKLEGVEALLRWHHPERGYIPPMDYIPLIEETGQIFDITSMVLRMAIRQKKVWDDKGYSFFKVAVNISAKSLIKGGLEIEIEKLLQEYGVNPKELVIEITETAFMDNFEASIYTLRRLEDLGVSISLDDFGTGYSSLAKLKSLPIHYVKMDREFIRTMHKNSEEEVVVRTIVELAHNLGLKIVAEGIETKEQKYILMESGCDLGQGYFISKPINPEEFEEKFLADNKKVSTDD